MSDLTAEDVAKMDVTERLDHIATLSPEMDRLIRESREDGMSDMLIFDHFRAARDMEAQTDG